MSNSIARRAIATLFAVGLIACEGSSPNAPVAPTIHFPARMQVTGGDTQTGVAGTELPQPLTVRVVDSAGAVIAGQVVNFRVVSGNGTVFAGASITDAQGRAAERWTVGTVAGESQRVEARAVNPATGAAIVFASFTATSTPGAVASLARLVPDSQLVQIGGVVALPPAVRTVDRFGNAVAGVSVLFRVTAGGGTLSDSAFVSDATGAARVTRWTAGPATGPNVVTVSSTGLASITFTATGTTTPGVCTAAAAVQMTVGQVLQLNAAQKSSLCLGGLSSAAEYVLIPFNSSTTSSAAAVPITLTGTGTSASIAPPAMSAMSMLSDGRALQPRAQSQRPSDLALRQREQRELPFSLAKSQRSTRARLTGIPANPSVGSIVELNANGTGNLCTAPKQLRGARVAAVLPHTLILIDTLAPAGGFTDADLLALGTAFDTLGYAVDTLNFGAPTDIDGNGRVAVFFTPTVNAMSVSANSTTIGYFTARDLFSTDARSGCVASNEGEMFYMSVPDPQRTINGNYASKSGLYRSVAPTLVHEFQHLINAGRRIYLTGATEFEQVWLNEGLSHLAEELMYYRVSGNNPRANIGLSTLIASQAQVDAANTFVVDNMINVSEYQLAPESSSPFANNDSFETRGSTWQLLRYAGDRKGGAETSTWRALVNSTFSGLTNFNGVFGDIAAFTRDWVVAQFADDTSMPMAVNYTNPSWDYRSVLPALQQSGLFPLRTQQLLSAPLSVSLVSGGASYMRFRVAASGLATVAGSSSGGTVPTGVDFMLVRTQ